MLPATCVYGLVSKGIFIGSATETTQFYNDLFIAAPVGSTPATNSTFQGSYTISYTDPLYSNQMRYLRPMPMGKETWAPSTPPAITSQATPHGSVSLQTLSQTLTGVKYNFSNGGASINFGGNGQVLLPTSVLLYISPDGNFVFGGAYNGFDLFVGVRTESGTPNFNGLYYQAGIDSDLAQFDTYYGSFNAYSDGTILEHQRVAGFGDYSLFYDSYTFTGDGTYDDQYLSATLHFRRRRSDPHRIWPGSIPVNLLF